LKAVKIQRTTFNKNLTYWLDKGSIFKAGNQYRVDVTSVVDRETAVELILEREHLRLHFDETVKLIAKAERIFEPDASMKILMFDGIQACLGILHKLDELKRQETEAIKRSKVPGLQTNTKAYDKLAAEISDFLGRCVSKGLEANHNFPEGLTERHQTFWDEVNTVLPSYDSYKNYFKAEKKPEEKKKLDERLKKKDKYSER